MEWTDRYRIPEKKRVRLADWPPDGTTGFDGKKKDAGRELDHLRVRLQELQELLFAERAHAVLVVLQGLDTAGKDGTIRRVFDGVNPQGVEVVPFRQPTAQELEHDFLWRVHAKTPLRGHVTIFNRSHYEDVLIVRVHKLVPEKRWKRRFRSINEFERELSEEGTTILKFFLHIDRAEQAARLGERLTDPAKRWKSSPSDLQESKLWADYERAFEEMLSKTSTPWAPWYLVPANRRWFRDLVVTQVIVDTLRGFKMRYPPLTPEVRAMLRA